MQIMSDAEGIYITQLKIPNGMRYKGVTQRCFIEKQMFVPQKKKTMRQYLINYKKWIDQQECFRRENYSIFY